LKLSPEQPVMVCRRSLKPEGRRKKRGKAVKDQTGCKVVFENQITNPARNEERKLRKRTQKDNVWPVASGELHGQPCPPNESNGKRRGKTSNGEKGGVSKTPHLYSALTQKKQNER